MNIEMIYIKSFGSLRERKYTLSPGINIFEGKNESGKSTIAAFIKFIFYGMQQKALSGRELTERRQYISWDGAFASGSLTISIEENMHPGKDASKKRILIERTLSMATDTAGKETYRESVRMTDLSVNSQIHKGKCPGEVIFGVPEEVYTGTAFVRQIGGARIDGARLSEATENLLFSADEAVNTQKAQEKIDDVRRRLLHKNGRGGSLYDKQMRKNELKPRLEAAKKNATELIGLDFAISELSAKREQLTARRDAARRKNHEYDVIQIKRRYDRIAEIEGELGALYEEKDRLLESGLSGGHFPSAEYARSLRSISDELAATSSSIAAAARQLDALRENEPHDTDAELRALLADGRAAVEPIMDKASILRHRRSAFIRTAVIFSLFAVLTGASALLLKAVFPEGIFAIAAAAAAFFGAVSVILFVAGAGAGSSYKKYLAKFGAAGTEELPVKLDALAAGSEAEAENRRRIEAAETEMYVQYSVYDDEKKRAAALLAERGITAEDDDLPAAARDAALQCTEICARDEALTSEIEKLKGEAEALRAESTEMTAAEAAAEAVNIDIAAYENVKPSELRLEREFNENAVTRLTESIHSLEVRRAQLAAAAENPSELAVAIENLEREIEEDRQRYQACVLAIETMERAGKAVRESVIPRLCENARRYMSDITEGKYDVLGVDDAFGMTVYADGAYRQLDSMSEGTCDAAYLALRLALTSLLYRSQTPPLVFDESFSRMDDERTRQMLARLREAGDEGIQTLIFTCQKREGRLCGEICGGEAAYIKLS